MRRLNINNNYSINRESIVDLPDIHHSLIVIPESLYDNSELTSTDSATSYYNNKSTPNSSIHDIAEEKNDEVVEEEKVEISEQNLDEPKEREINIDEEKSKNFTDIDLSETNPEKTNSSTLERPSITNDTSSIPVITPRSNVEDVEKSIKRKDEQEKQEFLEYLIEKIWELNLLQQFIPSAQVKDDEYFTLLNEQQVINKITEMIENDFITFEFCKDDHECLEISTSILSKWKSSINPNSSISFPGTCLMCHRHMPLTFHHLVPKMMHKRVIKKKLYTKDQCNARGIYICRPCHSACHKMISHEQMAYEYNTLDKLLEHEEVSKFVNWASKQRSYAKDHVIQKLRYSK
ncbi:5932_t:CDS:2 [Funneliformis caledonium]|uniref:5932_t:CDS:1 n=1 Tax=Funneliformis caledonium TaxID=1117310 RepID=A0A9N9EWH0_9GLOM|nr:5932_t:CDS:2 [Funneliformis caledonium]